MLPKKLNKKAFISYECKADYILKKIDPKNDFKEIYFTIENTISANSKIYTIEDYVSRLFYMEFIFKKSNVEYNDNIKAMDILKTMLLEYIIFQKSKALEKSLLSIYGICFSDITFSIDNKNTIGIVDSMNNIKVNNTLGYILVTYYKNLIYKDNFINTIIDKLGDIIERRECSGTIN